VAVEEIIAGNCLESTLLAAGRQTLFLPPLPEGTSLAVQDPTLAVGATNAALPAPQLVSPADESAFAEGDEIVLRWRPVQGLPPDGYYAVTVEFSRRGETWYDDVPWTRNTSWALSEHDYLPDTADDGEFRWSVQVVRLVGLDADGKPVGEALSNPSDGWGLTWNRKPGGGVTPTGTPSAPVP
jgi:hypothetical protein